MIKKKKDKIRYDCRFFDGSRPCAQNKQEASECPDCISYSRYKERILIIKLEAIGDVLRTTCILPKIKEKFPLSFVAWVTKPESTELISSNPGIDRVFDYNDIWSFNRLQLEEWDYVFNFDNSCSAAALTSLVKAKTKKGFLLSKKGVMTPSGKAALKWLTMASFDKEKKVNTESYQKIMYEICGFLPPIQKPVLSLSEEIIAWAKSLFKRLTSKKDGNAVFVGINTGSGRRWPKKMPDEKAIIKIIRLLLKSEPDWRIILLGGPQEKEKNKRIAKAVHSRLVIDIGCNHSLLRFSAIIGNCDAILAGDTLALHIASALSVPAVALFGPTSINEVYGYNGLIRKMALKRDCLCCYADCDKPDNCMSGFGAREIAGELKKQINR